MRGNNRSGRERPFLIDCREGPLGRTVRALEVGANGLGYEFAAFSETSPYSALGRVRAKMSRELATRHLPWGKDRPRMLQDILRGRIASADEGDVVLVVYGVALRLNDLEAVLRSHEGWEFELRIVDALE